MRGQLRRGVELAKEIVQTKIDVGEGAVLQKASHFFRSIVNHCDYGKLSNRATCLGGDVGEYERSITRFCHRVQKGWSDRTKQQSAYFLGLCQRLNEMAQSLKLIVEHKARIQPLIKIEYQRNCQQLNQSYGVFLDLFSVVLDPTKILPGGTCRRG